uniref:Uncharacterized protein n=1 Tax=Glossina palpalis gambiensis TaxID=67801 RepID=A0A1B0BA75_9MUSC
MNGTGGPGQIGSESNYAYFKKLIYYAAVLIFYFKASCTQGPLAQLLGKLLFTFYHKFKLWLDI